MTETAKKCALDEEIDEMIISIARTMENPPTDLLELIGDTNTSEDSGSTGTGSSEKKMGAELQALIDVVMGE